MTDNEVESLIKKRAEKYSANMTVPDMPVPDTPELLYFSAAVKNAKKKIAKRQNIQFAAFIAVALIVTAAMIFCVYKSIAVFICVQLLPVVFFVVLRLLARRTEAT